MVPPRLNPHRRRVILVGWDGADWKVASPLIDAGELPQLGNIVQHGSAGPLASYPPFLSPMLWTSIATGKYPDKHGIVGFASSDPVAGGLRPMQSSDRTCKAVWEILGEHGLTTNVIGWFASHPAESINGICVTDAFARPVPGRTRSPLPRGSIFPPKLDDEFALLRLHPDEVDPAVMRLFIPRIAEIDLRKDPRPLQLAVRLAELYSVHNAAIASLELGACDFLAVYYHFIDWVCHDFMEFYPPRRNNVSELEFDLYRDVVKSAYRLQDLLLRDLLAHAGDGVTVIVCSDHGFHSDERRPSRVPMVSAGIAAWHRFQGIFAAAGPGVARDTLASGATILDITPTILHLFNLPVARDMDGRIIPAAIGDPVPPVATYEGEHVHRPPHGRPNQLTEHDQQILIEQFAILGYVDLSGSGAESAAARNHRDNRWNLAISLRHAGRNEQALPLLEDIHSERPEDPRYAYHLALCQAHLGLHDEAVATAETVADFSREHPNIPLLLADIALAVRQPGLALDYLASADAHGASFAHLQQSRAHALLALGQHRAAAESFRLAIEADNETPSSWLGFSQVMLLVDQASDAESCAREAIKLAPTMALAFHILGQALAKQGKREPAHAALSRALELNPRLAVAERELRALSGEPRTTTRSEFESMLESERVGTLRVHCQQRREARARAMAARRSGTKPIPIAVPQAGLARMTADLPPGPCYIVTGLPRSGTSLMMQMLARGGFPVLTDDERAADESNPNGYYEWSEARNLATQPDLIAHAAGRAVKIVSTLLAHLPARGSYKMIFMTRPCRDIARSQHRMRLRTDPHAPAPELMEPLLEEHATAILSALRSAPNVEVMTVDYPQLLDDPDSIVDRLIAFLGAANLPSAHHMAAAVRPELCHHGKHHS